MIFADHLRQPGAPSSAVDPLGGNDLSCVVHVHPTFSDGHATVEEMLADARAAGAGALLLTDHDSLEARRQGWEGWHDGVLLLVGQEISPRGGHLLAFGLEGETDHRGRGERELTREVRPTDPRQLRPGPSVLQARPASATTIVLASGERGCRTGLGATTLLKGGPDGG